MLLENAPIVAQIVIGKQDPDLQNISKYCMASFLL